MSRNLNLGHLVERIRQRLSEQDLELLELARRRHERETYDASLYDQAFDRVLARVRSERGAELQQRLGLSS